MPLFIGQSRIDLPEVDSTNLYAQELLAELNGRLPEGTLITAQHQTAGRGQMGTVWEDVPHESLMCSLILYPQTLDIREQFSLSIAMALGVREFLVSLLPAEEAEHCQLKWSNDLYFKGKKLGGMLIENALNGHRISHSIVGIGLNINQTSFPSELSKAISLSQITQRQYNINDLSAQLCAYLEPRYLQLRRGEYGALRSDYLRVLWRYQEWAAYERVATSEQFTGQIVGVKPTGELMVDSGQPSLETFNLKEIIFLDNH